MDEPKPIHVDLSDLQPGAHAKIKLAAAVTHGARRAVERAFSEIEDANKRVDAFTLARIQHMVESWRLTGVDGKPLPEPKAVTLDQLEGVSAAIVRRIDRVINAEWRAVIGADEAEDPNVHRASS